MDYRNQNPMSYAVRESAGAYDQGLRTYMLGVYNYMGGALALTGLTAYLGAFWQPLHDLLYQQSQNGHLGLTGLGWIVTFAPLAMIFLGFGRMNRMTLSSAQAMFWVFAAVMGLSLSGICLVYTGQSVVRAFLSTAILFGAMGLWGYSTKKDLTSMGHFLMMGVVGVIIAMVVNFFLQSPGLQFAMSILGVVIFTGLTAYDTQKIKSYYYATGGNPDAAGKTAIYGALNLYLDFINMFMFLIQLTGNRRN